MENNIDTRFIKFSGKAEVEKDLTVGNNYSILSSGTVTAETLTDLHNGKFAKSYKWEVIQSEITDESEGTSCFLLMKPLGVFENLTP